ncbi:MAG: hypothetical protein EOM83_13815 [Clostridia bacterium]|nr:hypothetical protein [Clostridia bacterium]
MVWNLKFGIYLSFGIWNLEFLAQAPKNNKSSASGRSKQFQINLNSQNSITKLLRGLSFRIWNLFVIWNLEFGIWNLGFGIWDLEF